MLAYLQFNIFITKRVFMFPLEKLLAEKQTADPDELLEMFLSFVSSQGLSLYPAQEDGILALFQGDNVILNTPTGSGKSLVATALHFYSLARKRRSYYTCPIKALVNEKFIALCKIFGPKNVGMSTGDATVNPDAPIICCTAEILANIALREGEEIMVQDVIMDEFHYYSDRDRGAAWQIPLLIMKYSRFLLMSATLGDTEPFRKILDDLTGLNTTVIKGSERPVPLEFYYKEEALQNTLVNLVNNNKAPVYLVNFTQRECAENAQSLMSSDFSSKEEKQLIAAELKGKKFNSPYGKELQKILRHGIGIHHAGLLPKYRLIVEKLAQKGLLKVICGTDTLGVGVNVPIRTVLFTKLCKYDGEKVGLVLIRDFQQISGRAGRKGFDDKGTVVALAPEHVVENKKLESKAAGDPKKIRKIKRKPAPQKGYVHWDEQTFQKLIESEAEPLTSKFQVNHGMLLNVLGRRSGGPEAMRQLIKECHESPVIKERLRKQAFKLFRSLLEKGIVELVPIEGCIRRQVRVKIELQDDFSLFQELAIWLISTLPQLDPFSESYDLDLMTMVESIIENPRAILFKQIDKAKTQKVSELKAEGVEFEERMEILDKITYPKPNEEFIYSTFNEFLARHPWLEADNIKPKSIVREMYENYMSFDEYVKEYGLQRSEGLLLRYISEAYKVLAQSVPETYKNESIKELILFLKAIVTQVDNSLLFEWESLDSGKSVEEIESEKRGEEDSHDITANKRELYVLIRNEVFRVLRNLAVRNYRNLIASIEPMSPNGKSWQERDIEEVMNLYYSSHEQMLLDKSSRASDCLRIEIAAETCKIEQTILDTEGLNDWVVKMHVDLRETAENQVVSIYLDEIAQIENL